MMKSFLSAAVILILSQVMAASAFAQSQVSHEKTCLSDNEIKKTLKEYEIWQWRDDKDSWQKLEKVKKCEDGSLGHSLMRALIYLKSLPKIADENSQYPSPVLSEGPESYFRKRVKTIHLETNASSETCTLGATAYVMSNEKNTVHVCPSFPQWGDSDLMLSEVLIHEARHIEGYEHVSCTHGPMVNAPLKACDNTFQEQGSYGIGTSFLLNIYNVTKNPVLKMDARARIVEDLTARFNEWPLEIKPQIALHQADGQLARYNGQKALLPQAGKPQTVASRGGNLVLFYGNGDVKAYVYSAALAEAPGMFAQKYRDLNPSQRSGFIDIFYGEKYACLMFENGLKCSEGQGPETEIQFGKLRPVSFTNSTILPTFLDQEGFGYRLPADLAGLSGMKENEIERTEKTTGILSMAEVKMPGTKVFQYGITLDGRLMQRAPQQNWQPVPSLQQERFQKVVGPFYWSQKLEEL